MLVSHIISYKPPPLVRKENGKEKCHFENAIETNPTDFNEWPFSSFTLLNATVANCYVLKELSE